MLVIRPEQLRLFEHAAWRRFEDEMVAHCHSFAGRMVAAIDERQLAAVVKAGIAGAATYGFTCRGPIRSYIEFMFLLGSGFDTDPQFPVMGSVLRSRREEMARAHQLHALSLDYLAAVGGRNEARLPELLPRLLKVARGVATLSETDWTPILIAEMQRIWPRKAAYVGEAALTALVQAAGFESRSLRETDVHEQTLLAVLTFALGHRCAADPILPWIGTILHDDAVVDPDDRAGRLEAAAMTWLAQVAGGPSPAARQ